MKRKISIRAQITLSLVAFVILTVGLIFVIQNLFIDDIYKANKIKSIENAANNITLNLRNSDIESYIKDITTDDDICVGVISSNGYQLSDSRRNACPLMNLSLDQVSTIAYETQDAGGRKLFDNYKLLNYTKDDLFIYSILNNINGQDVLVMVSTVVTPIDAVTKTFSSQYLIISSIVIIMAIVLGFLLSSLIVKPINRIKFEAKNLPDGKYDGEKISPTSSESVELNNTLIEANEEIKKADKAKKELIANVSHDLRTPLTMIVGYGEMIKDFPEDDASENAEIIISEAKRLSSLVNDLLDASKSDKLQLNKEDTSLNELLKDVYNQYEKYCESMNFKFNLELIEDKMISVDIKRIKQVIYNLINNALNYNSKDNKEITLGVSKLEDKYRVYVLDNGDGIEEKDLSKIWDRYYKVDKEHKRSELGSGIGLSLAKSILENHELNYGVESQIGEYSKFYFDI